MVAQVNTTDIRTLYPGAPSGIRETPPEQIIYSGNVRTPYVEELAQLADQIDDVRAGLSRDMNRWDRIQRAAIDAGDEHVKQRATNELAGLHKLAARLSKL